MRTQQKAALEITRIVKEFQETVEMHEKLEKYLSCDDSTMVEISGEKMPTIRVDVEQVRGALRMLRDYQIEPKKVALERQIGQMYFATDPDKAAAEKDKEAGTKKNKIAMTTYG